ncbi:hypothetical protein EJ07DRAFT_171042 [Lizonia empirigonia]|nr:hypothetical protein EJ07DRAFT_171042 [Lizonia empirigonia]
MSFSDLPIELFDKIMYIYVQNEDFNKAARARQVCRAFNNFIPQVILHNTASIDLESLVWIGMLQYQEYLKNHIAGVLYIKVVHQQAGSSKYLKFLQDLVDDTLVQGWPMTPESYEAVRSRYARNICDALTCVEYNDVVQFASGRGKIKPEYIGKLRVVVAAAIGNVKMLLDNIATMKDVLMRVEWELPSALGAAVAANQTDMVDFIIKWVLARVQGPRVTGNWGDMREAASGLLEALRAAVRTRNDVMGRTILQLLTSKKALGKSLQRCSVYLLMDDCISYGNDEILIPALHYRRWRCWPDEEVCDTFDETMVWRILRDGSDGFIRRLIDAGSFKVRRADHASLMRYAPVHRSHLIEALLDNDEKISGKRRSRKRCSCKQ